jgi:hypothetical protein
MSERQQLDPGAYLRVFELHPEGALILEDLVARFGRNPYVPGPGGDRDTAFNAGTFKVVQHILNKIAVAQGAPDDSTVSTLDEPRG